MKFIKLLFSVIFITLLSISFNLVKTQAAENNDQFINENGITISSEEYKRLQYLGFNEKDIRKMTQEEYDLNKDLVGEGVIASTTKYFKVLETPETNVSYFSMSSSDNDTPLIKTETIELSKEEYEKEVENQKIVSNTPALKAAALPNPHSTHTSYKKMTTQIITLTSKKTYRIKNTLEWTKMPINRNTDVLGTALNGAIWQSNEGSQFGKQSWIMYDYVDSAYETGYSQYTNSSKKWDRTNSGYAVKMNLKNDEEYLGTGGYTSKEVTSIYLEEYFTVGRAVTNPTRIDAYGSYAHNEKTVSVSYSADVTPEGVGVTFEPDVSSKFTFQEKTHATIQF